MSGFASRNKPDIELKQFAFTAPNKCCKSRIAKNTVEGIYDIFTIIVSISDVITDVIVLVEFYIYDRMTFFYISLTILILSQLSYTIAFWWRFIECFHHSLNAICACCCLLPFSPILAFLFYFTEHENTRLYKFFEGLFESCSPRSITSDTAPKNKHLSTLKAWSTLKIAKHLGFIIEALIESFPQSILQLIAIVYYNDTDNYVAMLSILLSMISVSTKSFILSVNVSYNWTQALFNWCSCLIDFVAIFCIVSFIFYVPPNVSEMESNPFALPQTLWMYSVLCTVCPFTVIGSLIIIFHFTTRQAECTGHYFAELFFLILFWFVGLCLSLMAFTVCGFVVFSAWLWSTKSSQGLRGIITGPILLPLLYFVQNAQSIFIDGYYDEDEPLFVSKAQHQILRICCINRYVLENTSLVYFDYLDYLSKQSVVSTSSNRDYPYKRVTYAYMKSVGKDTENGKGKGFSAYLDLQTYVLGKFSDSYWMSDRNEFVRFETWIFVPLFVMGRLFHIVFMIWLPFYLYFGYDINVFNVNDIGIFQSVVFLCFLVLLFVWLVLMAFVVKEQRYTSLILWGGLEKSTDVANVTEYYHSIISGFVAQTYCVRLFGNDVAMIITQFYGFGDYQFRNNDMRYREVGLYTGNERLVN